MKSQLAQDTAKSAKNLARAVAKQMAQEPSEILRDVKEQAMGLEMLAQSEMYRPGDSGKSGKLEEQQKINDKIKSSRQMEALNREIADIRKQDLFKDLQKKISEGEEVPLEDYPELSPEQKQVLMAQMQAVKEQQAAAVKQEGFSEPATKKGRQLFNFGKKQEVKREQERVEKPVPPSG